MAQTIMYPAIANSPTTILNENVAIDATSILVIDGTKLPTAPNLLTIGTGEDAETILMTEKNTNTLTVIRGIEGVAKSWSAGEQIGRMFTAYDYNALKNNIEDLLEKIGGTETPTGTGREDTCLDATSLSSSTYSALTQYIEVLDDLWLKKIKFNIYSAAGLVVMNIRNPNLSILGTVSMNVTTSGWHEFILNTPISFKTGDFFWIETTFTNSIKLHSNSSLYVGYLWKSIGSSSSGSFLSLTENTRAFGLIEYDEV